MKGYRGAGGPCARAGCCCCYLRLRIILMPRRSCRWRARFIGASRYADIYARHVSISLSLSLPLSVPTKESAKGRRDWILRKLSAFIELRRRIVISEHLSHYWQRKIIIRNYHHY